MQLGLSLMLSFTAVFGISLHATSYVIANPVVRAAAALVIALTVFMFDRALYQSDWFYQGSVRDEGPSEGREASRRSASLWRFVRISARLAISFALAWIIALFLELAIFSDTITDKIKRDNLAANATTYDKIDRYENALDEDIAARRKSLAELELINRQKSAAPTPEPSVSPVPPDPYQPQILALDEQERQLRSAVGDLNAEVR